MNPCSYKNVRKEYSIGCNGEILRDGKSIENDEVVRDIKNILWVLMKADRKIALIESMLPDDNPLVKRKRQTKSK